MNIVWTSILILGLGVLVFIDPDNAFTTMLAGSEKAIDLSIKLWAVYALWLGVLQIMEDTHLDRFFTKILKPAINRLFGSADEYTRGQIAINITCNIFGMGNACTPSGINAVAGMDEGRGIVTGDMAMLIMFNTANIQLVPTTIIGKRIWHGSGSPSSIIIRTTLTSLGSDVLGVALCKLCAKIFDQNKKGRGKK